jgi:hypothetical protein
MLNFIYFQSSVIHFIRRPSFRSIKNNFLPETDWYKFPNLRSHQQKNSWNVVPIMAQNRVKPLEAQTIEKVADGLVNQFWVWKLSSYQ